MAIDRVAGAQRRLDVATGELAKAIRISDLVALMPKAERAAWGSKKRAAVAV